MPTRPDLLVFPLVMLMQMFSAGAMGGGVSSAIARALGAGQPARAQALALHAVCIGLAAGLGFTLLLWSAGPAIFHFLGGRGEVLALAVHYGGWVFAATPAIWLFNTLISVARGTGNMRIPSGGILAVSIVQVVLGATLGLTLYFAAQGAGNVAAPVAASVLRFVFVLVAGHAVAAAGAGPWALFALVGTAMLLYGGVTALGVHLTRWGPRVAPVSPVGWRSARSRTPALGAVPSWGSPAGSPQPTGCSRAMFMYGGVTTWPAGAVSSPAWSGIHWRRAQPIFLRPR